jgi:hypothetical protein
VCECVCVCVCVRAQEGARARVSGMKGCGRYLLLLMQDMPAVLSMHSRHQVIVNDKHIIVRKWECAMQQPLHV